MFQLLCKVQILKMNSYVNFWYLQVNLLEKKLLKTIKMYETAWRFSVSYKKKNPGQKFSISNKYTLQRVTRVDAA